MSVTPDVSKAGALASTLGLRSVTFDAIEARAAGAFDPGAAKEWALEPFMVSWQRVDREVRVTLPFDLTVTVAGQRAYGMHVTLRTTYDVRDGEEMPEPRDVDHYVGISGVLHAWPYLRAEVQSLSMKLGMASPIVLPNIVASQLPETVEVRRIGAATKKGGKRSAGK